MRRLLIVGAGIGGLTLLCALRHPQTGIRGWSIELAEKAGAFDPAGAGIVLQPNGMRVLARLGIADDVAARGSVLQRLEIVRGAHVRVLSLPELWDGVPHPTIAIARAELHAVLLQAGAPNGNEVRLRMAQEVRSVERRSSSSVVSFSDGSSAQYDVVVGADGAYSALRRALDASSAAVSTGLFYVRFAAGNEIRLPEETWRTVESDGAVYGFIPLSRDRLHCFVQVPHRDAARAADEEALVRRFGRADAVLAKVLAARAGPLHGGLGVVVRPVTWGGGTCVLIGDAAHAISPTLSEGGSLAMEDALVLALALRQENDTAEALARFRAARHERVLWAHRMSLSQARSAQRRRAPTWQDDAAAMRHLRQMGEPLRLDPTALLASPNRV